jgi:outer membrane protein OmpA-like peptidoglycan-associated protein
MRLKKVEIKKILIASAILLTGGFGFAQDENNLVNNGSFEEASSKVKRLGSISASTGWASPTAARADYFIQSKVAEINVPDNVYGSENAKDGFAYAGIVAFSYGDKMSRTYLMTKLNTTLKKGQKYCVEYNAALAEGSKYACNNLGLVISKKEFGSDGKGSIVDVPQISNSNMYNALFGWSKVCGTYIAEGGEKFLTLGNFFSNEDTKSEKNKSPKGVSATPIIAAYYYIDDVSIIALDEDESCDCGGAMAVGIEDEENFSKMVYQKQININDNMTPTDIINMQEIYFGFGQSRITPASTNAINLISEQMLKNPDLKINITGHCDSDEKMEGESKSKYAEMDKKRIEMVLKMFSEKGVAASRITSEVKSDTTPNPEVRVYDDLEMTQAKSRRVTFKVM